MSLRSMIKRVLAGTQDDSDGSRPRAMSVARPDANGITRPVTGRGKGDRLDEPPGAGKHNPDAAPEVLGGDTVRR